MKSRILVIQAAALGYDLLRNNRPDGTLCGLQCRSVQSVFPAVTCTAQAAFRTASSVSVHGMVGNGFFDREKSRAFFWEQSSSLVGGPRIWEKWRASGKTVGQMFWQQSLGTDSDIVISPAPIHKHHGGMIQDCFSRPSGLYRELVLKMGRPFSLADYWGPKASVKATSWIAGATAEVMRSQKPDLLLTYLPHLDYELQKTGPDSAGAGQAFSELEQHIAALVQAAEESDYEIVLFGDYAISPVRGAVYPNRTLFRGGMLSCRDVRGMMYPDLYTSRAFAVVDHQVAHVIVPDRFDINPVRGILEMEDGIAAVLVGQEIEDRGLNHSRTGDLVIVSEQDRWFAYPWWDEKRHAPDYATHVDIHNKPGYDPCELFWGFWPISVSTDADRIGGSHGLVNDATKTVLASTLDIPGEPQDIMSLARALGDILDGR